MATIELELGGEVVTGTVNERGNIEYFAYDTNWELNPVTGATRHCGVGAGCFWTDWEV